MLLHHDPDEEQGHEFVDDPGVLVHPVADLWQDPLRSLAQEDHGERRSAEQQQREAEEPNRVVNGVVRCVRIGRAAAEQERGRDDDADLDRRSQNIGGGRGPRALTRGEEER
jgi:hypothetical protein